MKKILIVLIFLFTISFLFATETIWMWDHNDSEVSFFRYSTSFDEKWRVVPSDHYSIKLDSGDIDDYEFYLQQSYDGEIWSDSAIALHGSIKDQAVVNKAIKEKGLVLSLQLVPFESYIATKPHNLSYEVKTAYSFGLDGEVSYFFGTFGVGAQVGINMGWEEFAFNPFAIAKERIYGGAYLTLSYKILDGTRFVILSQVGFGTNFELINNQMYLAPSVLVALEGGIRINEDVTISMKPSLIASFGSWKGQEEYTSFVIKSVSLGTSYRF